MLWSIAALFIGIWYVSLLTGYETGLSLHVLIAAAIVLLIFSIRREIRLYDKLPQSAHGRKYKRKLYRRGISFEKRAVENLSSETAPK